jgi:putative RNA 2'-phosphotransferase
MDNKEITTLSKFLSLVLRHKPHIIGIEMDESGWVLVPELIKKVKEHGHDLTLTKLKEIVATSDKKRFAFNQYESKIRANQGHSIKVDLKLDEKEPPEILYHGTVNQFLNSIYRQGLVKGQRHHVHLSEDVHTANSVGARRGKPILLKIDAGLMYDEGFKFYQSENGVWLTDTVPPQYLS